eukprot:1237458-Alexandrium_andersonii.AAC.1
MAPPRAPWSCCGSRRRRPSAMATSRRRRDGLQLILESSVCAHVIRTSLSLRNPHFAIASDCASEWGAHACMLLRTRSMHTR